MSRKRRIFFRAAHRDKAERAIINALRAVGASVHQISGKDIPDLLVGYRGTTFLLEVKSRLLSEEKGRKPRVRETKVSEGQKDFLATWRGGTARVVFTPEEALMAVGAPVEGVLDPLPTGRWHKALTVMREPDDMPDLIPIHPDSALGAYLKDMGEIEVEAHRLMSPSECHVVTPAFQREQTEAVVPKKRRKA